jgi:hypothetical protein
MAAHSSDDQDDTLNSLVGNNESVIVPSLDASTATILTQPGRLPREIIRDGYQAELMNFSLSTFNKLGRVLKMSFDGNETELSDYIAYFREYTEDYGTLIALMVSGFTGAARTWWKHHPYKYPGTAVGYRCFIQDLDEAFSTSSGAEEALAELTQLRLVDVNMRSWNSFRAQFMSLSMKLRMDSQHAIALLATKLPGVLAVHWQMRRHATLLAALESIQAIISSLARHHVLPGKPSKTPPAVSPTPVTPSEADLKNTTAARTRAPVKKHCQLHGECGHTDDQCRVQRRLAAARLTGLDRTVGAGTSGTPLATCWTCGELGHLSSACPQRSPAGSNTPPTDPQQE